MKDCEWWPADRVVAMQLEALTEVARHARDTTRFYRPKLAMFALDELFTESSFRELPIVTRRDLQEAGSGLFSEGYPVHHGPTRSVMTSGSTGQPVTVLHSGVTDGLWTAITMREHRWQERDLSAHLGAIRYVKDEDVGQPPDGTSVRGWGPATNPTHPDAPVTFLSVGVSIDEQAPWLQRTNPDYLLTHPSNLHALAEHFAKHELAPPSRLQQLRTVGETLKTETRELCRDVFRAPVVDIYSTQEVGYIALECPAAPATYHVQAESLYVEVLDDDDQPVTPGEVGRVVVSSLHNFASPILRYDIGDYAEVAGPCACGRGLPTWTRIVGRERGMWVRPDGSRAWPLITSKLCRKAARYRQMRLEQVKRDLIRVVVVPDGELDQRALTAALHTCLGYDIPLEFVLVDAIPRSAGGKFEEFICRID